MIVESSTGAEVAVDDSGAAAAPVSIASAIAASEAASAAADARLAAALAAERADGADADAHLFVDDDFTPFLPSLPDGTPGVAADVRDVAFMRPAQFLGADDGAPALFGDAGPTCADVVQGSLGDCFFLAALSVVATRPRALRKLFVTQEMNGNGVFACRFFYNGSWKTVVVDDRLPIHGSSSRPRYGHNGKKNELWVAVAEKAYAKLYGSYDAICGGNVSEALRDLTGAPVRDVNLENDKVQTSIASGELYAKLQRDFDAGFLVSCAFVCPLDGAPRPSKLKGILVNHAYSVLSVAVVCGAQLIRVRNPWAKVEWTGAWSDSSKKWTPQARAAVGDAAPGGDDGDFWMAFSDFVTVFNRLFVCMVRDESEGAPRTGAPAAPIPQEPMTFTGEWSVADGTAGGHSGYPTWRRNPQYEMHVTRPCNVFVSLSVPDRRLRTKEATKVGGSGKISYHQIGITVVQVKPGVTEEDMHTLRDRGPAWKDPRLTNGNYDVVAQSSYWEKRDTAIDVTVRPTDASRPYIIVPSIYFPGAEDGYWLTVEAVPTEPVPRTPRAGRRAVPPSSGSPAVASPAGTAVGGGAGGAGAAAAAPPTLVSVAPLDWRQQYPHVVTVQGEWKDGTDGGQPVNPHFYKNQQWLLQFDGIDASASNAIEAIAFLTQAARSSAKTKSEDPKKDAECKPSFLVQAPTHKPLKYHGVGLFAVERCGHIAQTTKWQELEYAGKVVFSNAAEVSRRLPVPEPLRPAGGVVEGTGAAVVQPPILLVPSTFKPTLRSRFELTVYCTVPIRLEPSELQRYGRAARLDTTDHHCFVSPAGSEATAASVAELYKGHPVAAADAAAGGAKAGRRRSAAGGAGGRRTAAASKPKRNSATGKPAKAGRRGRPRGGGAPSGAFGGMGAMAKAQTTQKGIAGMYAGLE